ncbi:unnamed protein product [Triticum turgidum subsp. durum]|uniref:Uncharacterized protein n=1 Tax=Triticum turgidum subsp. durum TaxID=4567 RepID=A0A9R1RWW6_TRITD|nr:unnamed protein product [Triticum turgidum subsp. durum]
MLPLAAARACLSFSAPSPRPQTLAAPPSPLPRRRSTATLPRPARIPLLRPLGAGAPGASSRPARDHVIDFGKHKGQMLGTLSPSYLRWVVAELDYGDTLVWACLAREVLDDPVYVDRKMAERFGWEVSDEYGWGLLDFRLLGTSYGGRIPRKTDRRQSTGSGSNRSPRGGGVLFDTGAADPDGPRGKRDERRERMWTRREEQVRTAKLDVLGVNSGAKSDSGADEASTPLTAVNARW